MSPSEDFVFVCPACEESMEVNPSMRDALVENGCVVCGATVTTSDFTPSEASADR